MSEKMFPIQVDRRDPPSPTEVPWSVAEKAYSIYSAKYGTDQSLARLGERGGFGVGEMDQYHPKWREESEEIPRLKAALKALLDRYDGADWEMVAHWAEWSEARKVLGLKKR